MFGWFACYCHAFHPSQDIAVFAVFEFVDLQMKALHSAFHRTVITSKLCILSSLLTILFFCYSSYCSDGFSSIWCCLLSFVSALCSESWAHGLHIFRWLQRHLCVQSNVINLAIKIALSTPLPSSSLVTAMSINCHHCFVGVLLVMLSSFWKCKRLCYQTLSSPSYVIELHPFDNECHQTIFWSKLVFVCRQYNSMVA